MSETTTSPLEDVQLYQMERSLEFARKEGDQDKLINALIDFGLALMQQGDAPKALTQYEEATTLAEALGNDALQARLWGLKGLALKALGNFDQARGAFTKSNRLARKIDHQIMNCDSLLQLGMLIAESGEVTKGISKLEQAYGVAMQIKETSRQMNIAQILGTYFTKLESSDKALEYLADGLALAKQSKNARAICSFNMGIAEVQLFEEIYDVAIENFGEALDLAASLEDPAAELSALIGLTRANAAAEKTGLAKRYATQAIELTRNRNHREGELYAIEVLTGILLDGEEYDRMLPHLERGLELAKQLGNPEAQLEMLTGTAFAYYGMEDLEHAKEAYETLLSEARQQQDMVAEATALGRLSAIFSEREEYDKAIEYAQLALEKAHESENIGLVAEHQLLVGLAFADQGQDDKARAYCGDAAKSYRSIGNEHLAAHAEGILESLAA